MVGDISFSGNLYQDGSLFSAGSWTTNASNHAYNTNSGNVGIGTNNPEPKAKLHLYEATGTVADASGNGTLVLEHGNAGGTSSITFVSQSNRHSDYAAITYESNAPGGNNENGTVDNQMSNDSDDEIIL